MQVVISVISIIAGILGILSGIAGLRGVFGSSKVERELEDHKLALARCQQLRDRQERELRICRQMWQWVALSLIVAGAVILLSQYSLARSR
jgi:hypothetical protein